MDTIYLLGGLGTDERVLPYRFVKPDITIHNGGHFMTVNKAEEVTKILRDLIGNNY